jgi:hypothetical protein
MKKAVTLIGFGCLGLMFSAGLLAAGRLEPEIVLICLTGAGISCAAILSGGMFILLAR